MGVIGIIVATLVNLFLQSCAAVRHLGDRRAGVRWPHRLGDPANQGQLLRGRMTHGDRKAAIMGALSLYLGFINMFIVLLQLFGNRE